MKIAKSINSNASYTGGFNNAFGMQLPNRHESVGDSYRYGYNGIEIDSEVKGEGNSYDFGARMYDSRVGRFLSRDPKESMFSWQSTYCFASNSPIVLIDGNGEGPIHPGKKRRIITNAFIVYDWELLEFDATSMANENYWDGSLVTAAAYNEEAHSDDTSYGDDYPKFKQRNFGGKEYKTEHKENGVLSMTENLLKEASNSERKINQEGNFINLSKAAKSGNYVYGEEDFGTYTITTVVNNWVRDEAVFEKNDNGIWEMKSKTHYDVTNRQVSYEEKTRKDALGLSYKYIVKTESYDVKTTTYTYDKDGNETKAVSNDKIIFESVE
jgi:RHS repeat-associated protein